MGKISISDLAKALVVSKTLVSLMLNGKGSAHGISPETQKRVLKKAQELNYRPSQLAKGLRTGRSDTIGLIVADISNPFYSRIARAVEEKASKAGFHLI